MSFNSRKMMIVYAITFCYVFSEIALHSSAAPISSKKVVVTDETKARHKNTESEKKNSISPIDTTGVSAKQEIETKSRSVKGHPKTVLLKPVPGQLEKLFPAATHLERQVDIAGQGGSSSDSDFLQEDIYEPEEEENEEGGGEEEEEQELPENDIYKRWQNILTDPSLLNILEENEIQRRKEAQEEEKLAEQEPLYSPELVEYLARVGAIDQTIDDLVINGEMSPREAAVYREAIEMEYGPPPPPSPVEIDVRQADEDPEELFDIANSIDNYGEPNDYIFPPVPPQDDYFTEYSEPPAPELIVPSEEEERRNEEEEEEDYQIYQELEEEELLREFLRTMALRQNEQEPSLESVAEENGNQKIGLSSIPAAVSVPSKSDSADVAVEKELEALPLQAKLNNKTPDVKAKEEELQLEEIRNTKTKQDNRTKPVSRETKSLSKDH